MKIVEDNPPPALKAPEKPKFQGSVKGFEDHDGDGDPVIDDAIIEEDDK